MKKFLMTLLVFVVAIVPLFSMIAMAYDYDNDKRFELNVRALNLDTLLEESPKEEPNILYSKVKYSASSEDIEGKVWVENVDGDRASAKYEIINDGATRQMFYLADMTFVEGGMVRFYGEQGSASAKYVIGRVYPY